MALGELTIVRNCSLWTLADMILSNLKTGRDEDPSWIRISPLSRPKFSPSQETTLSFIVEFRALRTVDPSRRYGLGRSYSGARDAPLPASHLHSWISPSGLSPAFRGFGESPRR